MVFLISNTNKKDFFYVVVLILTFITFLVGMAFAIYTWLYSHKEGSSSVYTGTLAIQYLSGDIVDLNNLIPSTKPKVTDTENLYKNDFKVRNTGSLDGIIKIDMEISLNQFSANTLKYVLYTTDGDEIVSGYLNGTNTVPLAENVAIASNSEVTFVLMVWMDENGEEQNTEMKKTLMGRITVDASQQID